MRYRIHAPVLDTPNVRDTLTLFVQHAGHVTLTFVTVAEPYKPRRLERSYAEVPDRYRAQAARALQIAAGSFDELAPVADVLRRRAEWTTTMLLRPTPDAPPLDGRTIAACASACLLVWYTRGRCGARLQLSEHDAELVATIDAAGWSARPARPWWHLRGQRVLAPWMGSPSVMPVPLTPAPPAASDSMCVPPAEPGAASANLVAALANDGDQQLARWLRTEIRGGPGDTLAAPAALLPLAGRAAPLVAPPGIGSTRPLQPGEAVTIAPAMERAPPVGDAWPSEDAEDADAAPVGS